MECAGKGSRTPCAGGPPTRGCHRCRAVAYCSLSHQVSHWSVHKSECKRLADGWNLPSELCPCTGPEKELLQLPVFGELQALFPGVRMHIDLVGPAVPHHRNGEQIHLSYARCSQMDCCCKDSVYNHTESRTTSDPCTVTLKLHAGCYHDCYGELAKIRMNPFRQPLRVEESALFLPCYSNCFLFGL
ncbi:UNVERIFIED_CONTAM: hypothetical protein Sangu_0512600 [Sesamum angustifolium]|uniref:MYND-type domain-containing protein n=1 Tax=Sesamum angustifolium TaxID=2727405 RepID=A0AAW2Q9G8_9LAMI